METLDISLTESQTIIEIVSNSLIKIEENLLSVKIFSKHRVMN
jgi:hypothetical protein